MKLEHVFTVRASKLDAFRLLTDVEAVAPCLPGAEVTGVESDHYKGRVKLKLGPIAAQYRGTLRILEQDEQSGRVVLRAEGRDSSGGGTAKATITAGLVELEDGTRVEAETDLAITGRVAQMGRGLLSEVSGKLMDEFAANLERRFENANTATEADPSAGGAKMSAAASGSATTEVEAVDLLALAGAPVLRRLAPVVAGLVALAVLLYWLLG